MKAAALSLAALLACAAASAQSFSQAKKNAAGMASAPGKAVGGGGGPVGRPATPAQTQALLGNASGMIATEALRIVQFVNDNGCVGGDGARQPLTVEGLRDAAKSVANPQNTELLLASPDKFSQLTGERGAIALAMVKELKPAFEQKLGLKLGDPKKDAVILVQNNPADPPPVESIASIHEVLHLVLRRLDNKHLGGGALRGDTGVEETGTASNGKTLLFGRFANQHHKLTDALNWKRVSWPQSTKPWTPREPRLDCDAAFAATEKEVEADRQSFTPHSNAR